MSAEPQKNDHRLTVNTFLGSATFTALFFLLQSRDTVKYYDYLVQVVPIATIFFPMLVINSVDNSLVIFLLLVCFFTATILNLIFAINTCSQ